MEDQDMELTLTQAATKSGKDRSTLYRAMKRGDLWYAEKQATPPMTGTFIVTTVRALEMWLNNPEMHKPGKGKKQPE